MRYVFDLDGVICSLKKPSESYEDVIPNHDVINLIQKLKKNNDYIIIYTARHMRTCDGNVDEVIKKIGGITKRWLEKWNVYYDELIFGKPYADVYIDDLGITFTSAKDIQIKLQKLQMNFVIPMAGEARRFKNSGIDKPKFMIKIKNKTMFEYAIESLPLDFAEKIYFICLKEHDEKFNVVEFIDSILLKNFKNLNYEIILIEEKTRGQAETILSVKKSIDNNQPLLIYNIDTIFKSTRLKSRLTGMNNQEIDGIIGGFLSNDPNLSFIEIDSDEYVKKIIEKEPISNIASTGLYIFSKGKNFISATEKMIKNKIYTKNEFYVSEVYNILIKDQKKFIVDIADEFSSLGTPEDLERFLKK